MKERVRNKLIALFMSLIMLLTIMPIASKTIYASSHSGIMLMNENGMDVFGQNSIYFGHYRQSSDGQGGFLNEPIEWRILENKLDNQGKPIGELFLLSEMIIESKLYHNTYASITWENSSIRTWLNDAFINTAFSSSEATLIKKTTVVNENNPFNGTSGGNNTEDKIFFLSISEATNTKYGFTGNYNPTSTRQAKITAYVKSKGAYTNANGNADWWLRSPGNTVASAAFVDFEGELYYIGIQTNVTPYGVRPAFNLNLSSIILASATVDGKSADVGSNSLAAPKQVTESASWKFTLEDEYHKDFKIDSVTTTDGKTLTIKYSKAQEDDNEYISAIIVDNKEEIKSYGKLALASKEDNSEVIINIEGKMSDGDKLYIFNEECNGNYETDYSSSLKEITIPKPHTVTYKIENGKWSDDLDTPKNEIVYTGKNPINIPTGMKPNKGYDPNGSWDTNPTTATITTDTEFTYTFYKATHKITYDLNGATLSFPLQTFNVEDGYYSKIPSWDDIKDWITPPANTTYDGVEIDGVKYNIGEVYTVHSDIVIKLLWKSNIAISYSYTSSDNNTYIKGSNTSLNFTINRNVDDNEASTRFTNIKVDGNDVASSNYEASSGSLKLTLLASYLESLSLGEHTLTTIFDDGEITTKFIIKQKANPYIVPNTGIKD